MPDITTSPGMFLKDPSTLGQGEDPFKYDVFREAVKDIAEKTKQVPIPSTADVPGQQLPEVKAAIKGFGTQAAAKKQEAAKAAQALALKGAGTEATMRRLAELQTEAMGRRQKASEAWGAAAEKAGEYVQSAELRTRQALNRLDSINAEISQGRDFAKAHAMNAAVQGVIGSMSEYEDQVVQKYGVDSKEYQQFQAKKAQTLSTTQSQIETSYRQLAEQQSLTYMNASNELQWKEDMYKSFQEQQHVETLRYLSQANDAYDMQLSQFNLAIEQMRGTEMENIANWIVQTPVFSMDVMPLVTFASDLVASRNAEIRANIAARGPAPETPAQKYARMEEAGYKYGISEAAARGGGSKAMTPVWYRS